MTNSDVGKRVMIERPYEMVSEEIQNPTGLATTKKKQGENNNKYALSLPHGLPRRNNQSTNKKQDPKSVPSDTDLKSYSSYNAEQRVRPDLKSKEREEARNQQSNPDLNRKETGGISGNLQRHLPPNEAALRPNRDGVTDVSSKYKQKNKYSLVLSSILEIGEDAVEWEETEIASVPCTPDNGDRGKTTKLKENSEVSQEQRSTSEQNREEYASFTGSQTRLSPFTAAVACVCRDDLGRIIDGFTKSVEVRTAEQAEVMALLKL